jgi:hypothetical protein
MKMKKSVMAGIVGCLLLGLSTCGRGGPTGPAVPTSAVNDQQAGPAGAAAGIEVSSLKGAYFIGETETFTASLTGPDGSPVVLTGGTWTSDTPEVATVNEDGLVTIVGQGWAGICWTLNGQTGAKQVWGRVDCRGAWSGTYSIVNCQAWGDFLGARFCETHGGSELPVALVLTKEGDAWDSLRGTITLGGLSTPFIAKPLLDGSLEMEGQVFSDPYKVDVAIGSSYSAEGPKFCMYLYYTGGGLGGRAQLECRISLSKTGA